MQNTDLIKLAPTLSAKERLKLVIASLQKEMEGGQSIITESERQALLRFEDRKMYEEYTSRVMLFRWANIIWVREIETEKLRVCALYIVLTDTLKMTLMSEDGTSTNKKIEQLFEKTNRHVAALRKATEVFYAYREAIAELEQELDGVSLFDRKTMSNISRCYELTEELFKFYNDFINDMCKLCAKEKCLKPILKNKDGYLIKVPTPSRESVKELVSHIKELAESDMGTR